MTWNAQSIKELRTQLGMSQTQFAETLGVSPSGVSSWERGRPPKGHHAQALDDLAQALADRSDPGWKTLVGTGPSGSPVLTRIRLTDGELLVQIGEEHGGMMIPFAEALLPARRFVEAVRA